MKINVTNLPDFVMAFGISGSGKSTYIRKNNPNKLVVCPDSIRKEVLGDVSDQSDNKLIWSRAIGRIEGALLTGQGVILDATNVNKEYAISLIKKLPKCYKIALVFNTDPSLAFDRVQRDLFLNKDRSNVPKEVILEQYKSFKETILIVDKYFDEVKLINS